MSTDSQHEGIPEKEEGGDDALWRLLERAPQPRPVSPYFARRVLREVASLAETRPAADGSPHWLARTWQALRRPPGVAFACVLVAAVLAAGGGTMLFTLRQHSPVAVSPPGPVAPATPGEEETAAVEIDPDAAPPTVAFSPDPVVTAQDVEIIADLDNVLSREESRLWTEDDTARF